jgi:uncharacterized protein YjiS (DUF1127 family)
MEQDMANVTITHIGSAGPLAWLAALLEAAVSLPVVWIRRKRQRRELMSLLGQPDYMLKDVGLQRHDITHEGLKPFWIA